MKPTELRIGNLFTTHVPLEGSWAERQRFQEQIYQCRICTFKDEETFKYFTGIPITENWLIKLGFCYVESSLCITDGFVELNYTDNELYICIESQSLLACVKYVHQLQNLWYTLTGVELAVTPALPLTLTALRPLPA